ncbi:hypothetical protein AT15_06315 [Kosmotoga arenicorallina S304]|uniref:CRISPR type III-associated protein domain-containing protein n=1 Tax=Kosmotoga arenicorallina S304 TaxID=1453497 RepID=A0A176JTP2_9BACT|nr:type III-B CRISPR module RAMP protein Cmr6 [Kosmotoga arenicorallina]OAA26686.1 hypothetical protein AT15_06315 [Kosmotoga arenicorallina S304]
MINPNFSPKNMNIRNPSLYFNKLLSINERNNDPKKISSPENLLHVSKICGTYNKNLLDNLAKRREKVSEFFGEKCLINERLNLQHRLLIGSGNPSIFEVGFTFSRNYGVPIIPGTALKGVLAHYIYEEFPCDHILKKNFKLLFGTDLNGDNNNKGLLIFLDAIPTKYRIGIDIVNNHFQPYYMKEDKPPNDWYNPNPVTYLVVENAKFLFTVLSSEPIRDDLKNSFKTVFLECLQNFGMGAKTSYGYGLFNKSKE